MRYLIKESKQYKKVFRKMVVSGKFDRVKLEQTIDIIASGEQLPEKYKDHKLSGGMKDFRECHVGSDLLLIYKIIDDELVLSLINLGSHSEIFGK